MRRTAPPFQRCFVDTSAYFALANHRDASHATAGSILEFLSQQRVQLFTSTYILAETHALLLNRLNRSLARTFVRQIREHSTTTVVRIGQRDENRAWQIIDQYADKDFTLTDATCFAVMERLSISHVFTLDDDFAQYGLTVVTPALFS